MGEEGKEGDWQCVSCRNRNYAFRSFCNRCKQPRILADTKSADSKWLPRLGDWICAACSNNNYASRDKCRKCGELKEVAAMPAVRIPEPSSRILSDIKPGDSKFLPRAGDWVCPGCSDINFASRDKCRKCGVLKEVAAMPALRMPEASLSMYSDYFSRGEGAIVPRMNFGLADHSPFNIGLADRTPFNIGLADRTPFSIGLADRTPFSIGLADRTPFNYNWPLGGPDRYGQLLPSGLPLVGSSSAGFPYVNNANQQAGPKGWRSGDWICNCGFHNYSSRTECKECNAAVPPSAKNMMPTLGVKRLASDEFPTEWDNKRLNTGNASYFSGNSHGHPHRGLDRTGGSSSGQASGSAKEWRDGDWMCTKCDNHNFASRERCYRCKVEREPVSPTASDA